MSKLIAVISAVFACTATSTAAQSITDGNWSGNYAGVYTSFSSGASNMTDAYGTTTGDFDIDGIVTGFTLGQNFQSNHFVYGVEMNIGLGNIDGQTTVDCSPCITEISSTATLSGRAGYAINRFLPYVTVGISSAPVSGDVNSGLFSAVDHVTGYTAGLGLEYAYSEDLSIDVRALYTDFEDLLIPAGADITVTNELYSVRLGINFHF